MFFSKTWFSCTTVVLCLVSIYKTHGALHSCVVLGLFSGLYTNDLAPEAGKALAEMLKTNSTIQNIKYVSATSTCL